MWNTSTFAPEILAQMRRTAVANRWIVPARVMSTTEPVVVSPLCPRCAGGHTLVACPQVRSVELDEFGRVKRVEFWEMESLGIPDKPRDGREYWFNQETREWVPYRPRM